MVSYLLDRDMAARHRARATSIQILKVETVISSKCRRPQVKQMFVSTTHKILQGDTILIIRLLYLLCKH